MNQHCFLFANKLLDSNNALTISPPSLLLSDARHIHS